MTILCAAFRGETVELVLIKINCSMSEEFQNQQEIQGSLQVMWDEALYLNLCGHTLRFLLYT